jgi:hypothetical protein
MQRHQQKGFEICFRLQLQKSQHIISCLGCHKYDVMLFFVFVFNFCFLPLAYEDCVPAAFWNSVNIVNYVKHLYAVFWGCRNLPNNKHEQGAWILGYKQNFSEASKFLDHALSVDLNFTKSLSKDYILHSLRL